MSRNIEIKAHYADPDRALEVVERLDCEYEGTDHQIDTFFEVAAGRMKLRESSLHGASLIPYLRENKAAPRASEYAVIPIPDVEKVKPLLERILGVAAIVEKERRIYHYQNVRIHLDRVKHLGTFIEFEAVINGDTTDEQGQELIRFLMDRFGIEPNDLVGEAYVDLLKNPEQKRSS